MSLSLASFSLLQSTQPRIQYVRLRGLNVGKLNNTSFFAIKLQHSSNSQWLDCTTMAKVTFIDWESPMRSLPSKIFFTHCLMLSWKPLIYSFSLDSMQKQQLWFLSDLDECATNTHSCDANAYCNNTIGSHNCTCYSGYNGTGLLCDSEYMQ